MYYKLNILIYLPYTITDLISVVVALLRRDINGLVVEVQEVLKLVKL